MTTEPGTLARGLVIDDEYIVHAPLDQGGMGAVYLVEQKSTGKVRALKVMHRAVALDPILRKRFEREARVGSRIQSDHVVDVIAAGVDVTHDLPYLVMELLEGETLAHRLIDGALTPAEARTVFEQVAHALGAAHAAGVVHRDLKPENVFLAKTRRTGGERFFVKVLDFGIAKVLADAASATEAGVGSPRWMAPEQTEVGPVGPQADVWSLGLVAFEALTGKSFWRAANIAGSTRGQLLREIVLDPIPCASERAQTLDVEACLPRGFDAWFERCVAREPSARFADANVAWEAMKPLLEVPETDPVAAPTFRPPARRVEETKRSASWRETPFTTVRAPALVVKTEEAQVKKKTNVVLAVLAVMTLITGLGLGLALARARPATAAPVSASTAAPPTVFEVNPSPVFATSAFPAPPPPPPTAVASAAPPAPLAPSAPRVAAPVSPPPRELREPREPREPTSAPPPRPAATTSVTIWTTESVGSNAAPPSLAEAVSPPPVIIVTPPPPLPFASARPHGR